MDIISAVVAVAAIQVVSVIWLRARLTASIKHEYDRKLEDYKTDQARREKAALVAELVAEWTHPRESTKRLNQLLWEVSLYLPSHLVKDLNRTLANRPGCKPIPQVLADVRSYLLEGSDPVPEEEIFHFKDSANPHMISTPKENT